MPSHIMYLHYHHMLIRTSCKQGNVVKANNYWLFVQRNHTAESRLEVLVVFKQFKCPTNYCLLTTYQLQLTVP